MTMQAKNFMLCEKCPAAFDVEYTELNGVCPFCNNKLCKVREIGDNDGEDVEMVVVNNGIFSNVFVKVKD